MAKSYKSRNLSAQIYRISCNHKHIFKSGTEFVKAQTSVDWREGVRRQGGEAFVFVENVRHTNSFPFSMACLEYVDGGRMTPEDCYLADRALITGRIYCIDKGDGACSIDIPVLPVKTVSKTSTKQLPPASKEDLRDLLLFAFPYTYDLKLFYYKLTPKGGKAFLVSNVYDGVERILNDFPCAKLAVELHKHFRTGACSIFGGF